MALDGMTIRCLVRELDELLKNGRAEKITQPEKDEINMNIHNANGRFRLVLSANPSNPRVHISESAKENPEKAPMFLMLLRKHFSGSKLLQVSQENAERIIKFTFRSINELGDDEEKNIICEIMGRHSNIILTNSKNIILGSIKHVDFSVSTVRQLLPGMEYELPPSQNKENPFEADKEKILSIINSSGDIPADRFISDSFTGVGPLNAREIAYKAFKTTDFNVMFMTTEQRIIFADMLFDYFTTIKEGEFSPVVLYKTDSNRTVWDFNSTQITQYEDSVLCQKSNSMNMAIDTFYSVRDRQERLRQKGAELLRVLDKNISRCEKKLSIQKKTYQDSQKRDKYKIFGDLLASYRHEIKPGAKSVRLPNFYDNMKEVEVPLLEELSPQRNIDRYYKLFQKAKNAEKISKEQIEKTEAELLYLETVAESLLRAETVSDIAQIRSELSGGGYIRREMVKGGRRQKEKDPELTSFIIDGYELYVGKNNIQNDFLTTKFSRNKDIWFHVKDFPGSHAVIKTAGDMPHDDTLVKAAKICAYFSKARASANVAVDYTFIKNVKKPSGAKPGYVIYDTNKTINVTPTAPEIIEDKSE